MVVFMAFSLPFFLVRGSSSRKLPPPSSVLAQWVFLEPAGQELSHHRGWLV